MLGAATTPLIRYFGVFQEALPSARAQMNTSRAQANVTAEPVAASLAPQPKTTPHESRVAQLAELERLVPTEPAAATAWLLNAANERRLSGDVALAELMLARALEHDEDSPELAFAFAQVRKTQGNLEGAEGWLLKAMRLKPREPAYQEFYAELLRSLGRTREADRAARRAQALSR
jgi:tetratricopeptide (TPR) repeat protein